MSDAKTMSNLNNQPIQEHPEFPPLWEMLNSMKVNIDRLNVSVSRLTNENIELTSNLSKANQKIDSLTNENVELRRDLSTANQNINRLNNENREFRNEINRLNIRELDRIHRSTFVDLYKILNHKEDKKNGKKKILHIPNNSVFNRINIARNQESHQCYKFPKKSDSTMILIYSKYMEVINSNRSLLQCNTCSDEELNHAINDLINQMKMFIIGKLIVESEIDNEFVENFLKV